MPHPHPGGVAGRVRLTCMATLERLQPVRVGARAASMYSRVLAQPGPTVTDGWNERCAPFGLDQGRQTSSYYTAGPVGP